jgi:hypothetical protein
MVPAELPTSRVSDPADAPPLNWGILGGGWIAGRFVDAATRLGNQQVIAIGSRGFSAHRPRSSPGARRRRTASTARCRR